MGEFRMVHVGVAALLSAAVVTGVGLVDAAGPGTSSVFVPIVPCRLADTRATDRVGQRIIPIAAQETVAFMVWGTNGNCTIPTTATGIATNVTAVNPTASSYLTVYPSGAIRPLSSNLNWTPTSPPTPNQVTVGLSGDGSISTYNLAGAVDVIIDIVGYYEPAATGGQGPAGPTGPAGLNGTNGTDGDDGARGFSAWDIIPSGQSVTGSEYFISNASTASANFGFSVALPGVAPVALASDMVNFAVGFGNDQDPSCTGSVANPTAPAGKICLYRQTASNNSAAISGYAPTQRSDRAFLVAWASVTPGDTAIEFTWAYTAP